MPRVARIDAYPVKGLDRCPLDKTRIRPGGTLEHDREYVLRDAEGAVINGKRTARVHDVDIDYDPDTGTLAAAVGGGESRRFDLPAETDDAAQFFSGVFDVPLTLHRAGEQGFVDRPDYGPSVISTATLEEIASWYDGMTLEGARRRFRANVEIEGVPAFWEDRFVGNDAPALGIGDVKLEGETPCGRCVVPARDPDTGDEIDGFQQRFVERREATFPEWADRDAFEHFYTVMVITSVHGADRGETIAVGDPVEAISAETRAQSVD